MIFRDFFSDFTSCDFKTFLKNRFYIHPRFLHFSLEWQGTLLFICSTVLINNTWRGFYREVLAEGACAVNSHRVGKDVGSVFRIFRCLWTVLKLFSG